MIRIRDLLLSIGMYGAVAFCLAVLSQLNPRLYGKVLRHGPRCWYNQGSSSRDYD